MGTRVARVGAATARAVRWRRVWRAAARSPTAVAGLVLAIYGIWLLVAFATGQDARDFARLGASYALASRHSAVSWYDPHYQYFTAGYDGQYDYYIAVDPAHAFQFIASPGYPPAYRYTRILYPMLARLLAFGRAPWVPYTLILINWLALAGGTLAVAAWLKRKDRSPWLALIYPFAIGLFVGLLCDLNEPLAFGLVALGVYLFDFGGGRRVIWSAAAFALALLARESVVVFPAVYGLALLLAGVGSWRARVAAHWWTAAVFGGIAFLPFAAYKAFLTLWLGSAGVPKGVQPMLIPLAGLFALWPWHGDQIWQVVTVVLPAAIVTALALWALRRGHATVEVWTLLANATLYVAMLWPASYLDAAAPARVSLGVVLGALYCLPIFDDLTRGKRRWLAVCAGLWTATTFALLLLFAYWWMHGISPRM